MPRKEAVTPADKAEVLLLNPDLIQADDNSRFALKQSRVDSLAKSITERGEVLEPVEAEELAQAVNGFKYSLTTGFYRHAAVIELNKSGAGILLPTIVRTADKRERLRRQIDENLQRENMTPMDTAIAIKRLLDAGMSKAEVREVFSRPGGRKGNKTQPASNSFINMHLSFLNFPKKIQTKLHDGTLTVSGGYELTRVAPEKWDNILDRAEEAIAKESAKEERDEKAYLKQIEKQEEDNKKRTELQTVAAELEVKLKTARELLESKNVEVTAALKDKMATDINDKERKARSKVFNAKEKEATVLHADVAKAQDLYTDASTKLTKFDELAATKKAKLAEARGDAPKKAAVSGAEVKKAAVAAKATKEFVVLKVQDIRKGITYLQQSTNQGVREVAHVMMRFIAGELTEAETEKELAKALKAL